MQTLRDGGRVAACELGDGRLVRHILQDFERITLEQWNIPGEGDSEPVSLLGGFRDLSEQHVKVDVGTFSEMPKDRNLILNRVRRHESNARADRCWESGHTVEVCFRALGRVDYLRMRAGPRR